MTGKIPSGTDYIITDETKQKYGCTFHRMTRYGKPAGWIEAGGELPEDTSARIYGDTLIFAAAAANIQGGEFWDGEFWDGEFWDGVFQGGVFWGGVFRGGVFRGGEFHSSPCCAQRSDGYMFVAKYVDGELRIWAGCRNFSWEQSVAHWDDGHYMGAESQRIIHFLKSQAEAERDRDAKRGEG